jgi:uncharacterized integral membrane protein (TIGR00698 family)
MKKLLKNEDSWAIIIGAFYILFGLLTYFMVPYSDVRKELALIEAKSESENGFPYRTVDWYLLQEEKAKTSSLETPSGKFLNTLLRTPKKWTYDPMEAVYRKSLYPEGELEKLRDSLDQLEKDAKGHQKAYAKSKEESSLERASLSASKWYATKQSLDKKKKERAPYNLLWSLPVLALALGSVFALGSHSMGTGFIPFLIGFFGIFALALVSFILGSQYHVHSMGFGYPLWGIVLGLLIANTLGTPSWMQPALKTEFYVKTGLVLLGAEILFGKILAIGLPGIFVAWVVTPIVLVLTFWFGQKVLKIPSRSLNMTISADMSVCGVSAAIATAAASNATKEELTLAVGLSMVFTSFMMVLLPAFCNLVGMPEVLGGAWIGGTVDATGAVVAAGAFLGDTALQVAATIKMIQNMMIGLIALAVAYYFAKTSNNSKKTKVNASELWVRFPKFILGFVGASLVVSLLYHGSGPALGDALIDQGLIRGFTKDLRGWFFCFAFVSIGLSVNFKELRLQLRGGKPLVLYVLGQLFNLLLTLGVAYLMFYVVFPEVTESL